MELLDRRKIIIYQDHLARDYYNFGSGTNYSCYNNWTLNAFGVTISNMPKWNCHGSVWHAYDGSNGEEMTSVPNLNVVVELKRGSYFGDQSQILVYHINQALQSNGEETLKRGDIIVYYSTDDPNDPIDEWQLQHSQTMFSNWLTYGANNTPLTSTGGESWLWDTSNPGAYMNDLPYNVVPMWNNRAVRVLRN